MTNTNQTATEVAKEDINLFDVNRNLECAFCSLNAELCEEAIVRFANMLGCTPNIDEVEKGYACESVMGLYAAARTAQKSIGDAYRLLNGKEVSE